MLAPWRIVYKEQQEKIFIVAVFDGRRNIEDILLRRLLRDQSRWAACFAASSGFAFRKVVVIQGPAQSQVSMVRVLAPAPTEVDRVTALDLELRTQCLRGVH